MRKDKPQLSHLSTDIQTHIAEGRRLVEALLAQQQVHFQGRTVNTPDESGIYVFSNRRPKKLDGQGEAHMIALACGEPPEGRAGGP